MKLVRTPEERFALLPGYPFAPHYTEVADPDGTKLRVHYVDEGPASADPVLMLHGEKDALVDERDTLEGFTEVASTDRQMKIYGGLFHEIFNEYCHDETIGDAAAWLVRRA